MSMHTLIDVLRHGACEGGNIFRGSIDVALTRQGVEQMQRALTGTEQLWQCVVSSPLRRCSAFAESVAGNTPVVVDERLREMSFGEWDGRQIDEIWRSDHSRISAWSLDPSVHSPPGGESLIDLAARVQECLQDLLARHRGQRLLLITHGGVVRVLLAQLLGMPLAYANRLDVPYACFSRLGIYHQAGGDVIRLLGHNCVPEGRAND